MPARARAATHSEARDHAACEAAAVLLADCDQRLTSQRERLVEVLAQSSRPLTIPEILDRIDGLAQSSAYRNLTVLEAADVVRRIVTRDEFARYELAEHFTGHHHHVICVQCGRVEDIPATPALERSLRAAVDTAAEASGFVVDHHQLDLLGRCADCR